MSNNSRIAETLFVVVDFETVTPKGRPPEPLEFAALIVGPNLEIQKESFETLIKPPADAKITAFDTAQTGIRNSDVAYAPSSTEVMSRFFQWLAARDIVFVAQNARYEMGIFKRYEEQCPGLSTKPFIDTIMLAKSLLPGLMNYRLDTVANRLEEAIPRARHRAMPDVQLTAKILVRLTHSGIKQFNWYLLMDMLRVSGISERGTSVGPERGCGQMELL